MLPSGGAEQARREAVEQALEAAAKLEQAAAIALNKPGANRGKAEVLLSEASRSYQIAKNDARQLQDCPSGRRVYPHVGQEGDKAVVQGLVPALRAADFIVPPVQIVTREMLPAAPVVRYFRHNEREGAESVTAALKNALPDVAAGFVPGYEKTTRPCHYELWLPVGTSKAPATKNYRFGAMNVDVFYCADASPKNSDLAKRLLILREGNSSGKWRVRELTSTLNASPGYGLSSDVIRFNADEREIAERLKADIGKSTSVAINLQEISFPTPGYISVFLCGAR